jgi:hypothetical protein
MVFSYTAQSTVAKFSTCHPQNSKDKPLKIATVFFFQEQSVTVQSNKVTCLAGSCKKGSNAHFIKQFKRRSEGIKRG